MRVTLKEISKQTGISMSVLSRGVNGHGYVSPEVREKANDALTGYGYVRSLPKQINENALDNIVPLFTDDLGK